MELRVHLAAAVNRIVVILCALLSEGRFCLRKLFTQTSVYRRNGDSDYGRHSEWWKMCVVKKKGFWCKIGLSVKEKFELFFTSLEK